MSTDFVITSENNPARFRDSVAKGEAITYRFDFTPWQEDNSPIISVTWNVESGQAAITGETLVNGIATALITVAESGGSLTKITANTGTEIKVVSLDILAKDAARPTASDDYGRRCC